MSTAELEIVHKGTDQPNGGACDSVQLGGAAAAAQTRIRDSQSRAGAFRS
jgi:hypothetical protein